MPAVTVPVVQIWDQAKTPANAVLSGATVRVTLNHNQATYSNPVVMLPSVGISTTTDSTGYWTVSVAANDLINPSGTTYMVQVDGYAPFDIDVESTGVPVGGWQASAIVVNAPAGIGSAGFNLPSPVTATGILNVNGDARFYGLDPWVDVTHPSYGAVGDGVTDDTAAFVAAFTAAGAGGRVLVPQVRTTTNYNLATFTGWDSTGYHIDGPGIGGATVTLPASAYLMTPSGSYSNIEVHGFKVSGGLGLFHATKTGANVNNHMHKIHDMELVDYTSCAIGHNCSDDPYWRIFNIIFNPANSSTAIGIALAGLGGATEIFNNEFLAGKVAIKLGNSGNEYRITGNGFLQKGAGTSRVSGVWCVPDVTGTNAGQGLIVAQNKFGNENQDPTDYQILYADGSGGGDFTTDLFNVGADSAGFIDGHRFTDNDYSGAAGRGPLVYTTTPNVRACWYQGNLKATLPSYLIQYRTVPLAPSRTNSRNYFGPFQMRSASELVTAPLSNATGVGYLIDPDGVLEDNQSAVLSGGADYTGYARLAPNLINAWTLSGASKVAITDTEGGPDATELTATSAADAILNNLTTANVVVGDPIWIEFDLAPGSSLPMATITVKLEYTSGGNNQMWQRVLNVPPVWRRYRFLTFSRSTSTTNRIIFTTTGWVTGTATKVQIGRVRCYHAKEPVPYSLHTLGGIYPGNPARGLQAVAAIYAGSGAPSNTDGINGDYYMRSDGTQAGNTLWYHKESGAWVALQAGLTNNLLAGRLFGGGFTGQPTTTNLNAHATSATLDAASNDLCGLLTIVTDATGMTGLSRVCTVNFNNAGGYVAAPLVWLQNLTGGTIDTTHYSQFFTVDAVTTSGFDVKVGAAATGAQIATIKIAYFVVGRAS